MWEGIDAGQLLTVGLILSSIGSVVLAVMPVTDPETLARRLRPTWKQPGFHLSEDAALRTQMWTFFGFLTLFAGLASLLLHHFLTDPPPPGEWPEVGFLVALGLVCAGVGSYGLKRFLAFRVEQVLSDDGE